MSLPDYLSPVSALPSVEPMAAVHSSTQVLGPDSTGPVAAGGFPSLVSQGLAQVNDSLLSSQVDMQKLAAGEASNLHQIMIRMEESRLSFQLMLQVRNRLLESYQEVMRMQV